MSQASEPPAVDIKDETLSNLQAIPIQCWLLLCYLGEDGVSLRAMRVPLKDSSRIICGIQGWFQNFDSSLAPYEMQTNRELICVIRSQPFAAGEEGKAQLQDLRRLALDVMSPDIDAKVKSAPPPPLSQLLDSIRFDSQAAGDSPVAETQADLELIRPDISRVMPPLSDE